MASGERGAARVGQLALGLDKFVEHDVAPTVKSVAQTVRDTGDDILKVLAPAARGRDAKAAALIMRGRLGELARRSDRVMAALAQAKKYFDSQTPEQNYQFIDRVENGQPQPTAELQTIANTFRKTMDERRTEVQALGTGELEHFYGNYFPHIWEDSQRAAEVMRNISNKHRLEGSKAFLKQREFVTTKEGLDARLKPIIP